MEALLKQEVFTLVDYLLPQFLHSQDFYCSLFLEIFVLMANLIALPYLHHLET